MYNPKVAEVMKHYHEMVNKHSEELAESRIDWIVLEFFDYQTNSIRTQLVPNVVLTFRN